MKNACPNLPHNWRVTGPYYATLCHSVGRYFGKTSLCQHTYQFWVNVTWLPSQKQTVHSTPQLHRAIAEAMRRPCDKSGTQCTKAWTTLALASSPFTSAPKPRQHMQVAQAQMSHSPCRPMSQFVPLEPLHIIMQIGATEVPVAHQV